MKHLRLLLAALGLAAPGQAGLSSTAKADVDAYCAKIAKAVETHALKPRFFVDTSARPEAARHWVEFKSQAAIDKACLDRPCIQTAWIYVQAGHPVLAAFTYGSWSGDWSNNVDYYFYSNGQTASDRSEFRRAQSDSACELQRRRDYDPEGTPLAEEKPKYFLVRGDSRVPTEPVELEDGLWPQFKQVQDLPMAKVLKKK